MDLQASVWLTAEALRARPSTRLRMRGYEEFRSWWACRTMRTLGLRGKYSSEQTRKSQKYRSKIEIYNCRCNSRPRYIGASLTSVSSVVSAVFAMWIGLLWEERVCDDHVLCQSVK